MKPIGLIKTGALLLLSGAAAPMQARQDPHEQEVKPQKQEQENRPDRQRPSEPGRQKPAEPARQRQAEPAKQQPPEPAKQERDHQVPNPQERRQEPPHSQPQPQPRPQAQAQRPRPQNRQPAAQQEQRTRGGQRAIWQGHRANNWQSEHRDWGQRGGYSGYRIPDDRFRGGFGQDHAFRIRSYPLVVYGGYPRFQYGGFWFGIMDPWPEYWSATWYDDDDVYIDYWDGGYYLYNRQYPQDRIAITVSLN